MAMAFVFMSMNIEYSDLSIPKHIARKLKIDAARLSIRMEWEGVKVSEQNVEISSKKANLIYNVLVAVYESGSSEAQRVMDCNIRASSDIAIDRFWIVYEKNVSWAPESHNDENYEASGNIGDLLDEYDLVITKKKRWNDLHEIITIESRQLYNIKALIEKFKGEEGVQDVFPKNSDLKADSDIEISLKDGEWYVSYIKKWSSLKDSRSHKWEFEVNQSNYKSKFLGESGDIIPDWMSCELSIGKEY